MLDQITNRSRWTCPLLFSRRETYQFVHVAVVKLIAYVLSHGTGNDFEYVVGRVERKTSRMVLGLREGPSRGVEGRSERLGMLELSSLERFM